MLLTALTAAGTLASAIYGAVASSKQNKKAQQQIQQQRDDNRAWYNAKMSQDYTQRSDAQAVINRQRELLEEQMKNANAAGTVTGASDASIAMQKAAANDAMAQTMSDIASEASDYKDQVESQYRAQDSALAQQQAQNDANQAQATAAAAGQAVNAGLNLIGNTAAMPGKPKAAAAATPGMDTSAAAGAAYANQKLNNTIRDQFVNSVPKSL